MAMTNRQSRDKDNIGHNAQNKVKQQRNATQKTTKMINTNPPTTYGEIIGSCEGEALPVS